MYLILIMTRNFSFSKFIWVFIVVASLGVASVFLCTAGYEFINKVVVTTIDTTTASLQVRHFLFQNVDCSIYFKTYNISTFIVKNLKIKVFQNQRETFHKKTIHIEYTTKYYRLQYVNVQNGGLNFVV